MSGEKKFKLDTECGINLYTRLQSKKRATIENLSPEIIPSYGPRPGEIVEISGESGTGKTIHLMELIARTIIPVEFGGKGASVIVIDTNSNFHVPFLLPKIIEKHLIHHRTLACPSTDTEDLQAATHNIADIVLESMQRITFFKCFSGTEYKLILLYCTNHLTANASISLLVVDSIATFYWSEFTDEKPIRMDMYLQQRVQELRQLTNEFKVVATYTRPAEFGSTSTVTSEQHADYKIQLKHTKTPKQWREARNYYSNQQSSRPFSINSFGIQWLSSTS
ncbi:DNA repair protein XRCC2 [Sitodiplosis mosellana]|uniref:DNA repair protein XRCC2 n=1 Tax=Sitodiplosis mosellana TaxID=263140 RepID=UPI0024443710|nr:DNA repair protein XRCC2 [Sitodiplosis mosellana]